MYLCMSKNPKNEYIYLIPSASLALALDEYQ
jgi:hypothetical protein